MRGSYASIRVETVHLLPQNKIITRLLGESVTINNKNRVIKQQSGRGETAIREDCVVRIMGSVESGAQRREIRLDEGWS